MMIPTPETQQTRKSHFAKIKDKTKYLFKKYGWKLGLVIFLGYLIRDTVLYIIIPYLIAKNFIID